MRKYLFFALIIGILTVMPSLFSISHATTLQQAQIDAVNALLRSFGVDQATISNVNATLSGKTAVVPTTAAWCHDFNMNLRVGDNGNEVSALLNALVKEDVASERSSNFASTFDETLAAAVVGFQQKYADEILTPNGLKYGTGFVGPSTRAKLNKLYGCKGVTPPPFVVTPPVVTPVTPTPVTPTSPTVTPSITVLSPNGGEVWYPGETHTIRWNNNNIGKDAVYIYIYDSNISGSGSTNYITPNGQSVSGTQTMTGSVGDSVGAYYDWTIPLLNQLPGGGSKNYRIRIDNASDTTIRDSSDAPFSIVAKQTSNLPDLVISDFSWTPISPKSVENITVNVKVKNVGLATAQNFSVTNLWDSNGKEINISSLAAGGETTIQGTIGGLSYPGPNVVTMSVDALNKVAESNKDNNSLNKTINVSPVYVGDGSATLKHWETWQLSNGYILYADGGNVFGQTPYKVNFRVYDPKANYQVVATSPDLGVGASWALASQNISIKVNEINVYSPGNANWSVKLTASSGSVTTPTTPVINSISPNSSSYVTGATANFSWARTGDFAKANSYYFVYLKQGSSQILGGASPSPAYTALVFRSATLDYPSFNVTIPNGITPGTYYLELDYADSNGSPLASITSSAFTITAPTSSILPAPTGFSATVLSNGMFSLSWTDNSSNEDGFKIEQKEGAGGSWAVVSTPIANVHSASFGSAKPNVQYYFRIKAYNSASESTYSGESSAIMTVNVPIAPSYLSAVPVSSSQINLAWSDNSANEGGFVIEYKQGSAGLWTALISNLSANNTQYTVSSLNGNTAYYFRVKAYNAAGESVYSSEASAITQPLANDATNTTGAPLAIGDVSKDSKVDVADALYVAQYVVGSRTFDPAQLIAADVNKDGKVTTNDAKIIAIYNVGNITALPIVLKIGDINQDGIITSYDALLVSKHLSGTALTSLQEAAADVNNDSVITQEDADIILKASVGIIKDLPYTGTTSFVPSASQQSASILNAIRYILK